MKKRKTICFAYFADGKFIGWHSDTFGTITLSSPKIYGYSERQVDIVRKNFIHKVNKAKGLQEDDFLSKVSKVITSVNPIAGALMIEEKSPLSQYNEIELRIVECPIYDGPNPDFNEQAYDKLMEERKQKMTEEGVLAIPAPSKERTEAVRLFDEKYGKVKCDNWIYADYKQVKEWAIKEPTVFIETIKS